MKVAVVGIGYVGLSIATLLSKNNDVELYDINDEKINQINNWKIPIKDNYLLNYINKENIKLKATRDTKRLYKESSIVIICTSTNFEEKTNSFDTSSVDSTIEQVLKINKNISIIIKSTVSVGFTEKMKKKYNYENIIFSPEFLREGKALYDNLYPSRIIVGGFNKDAITFANLMKDNCLKNNVDILYMNSTEAEAVKLFSNTYLAMRVSFFNELDTFAELNNLNSKNIIDGVCLDDRIGNYYNNPSFGYGGYCLPKDTKQLLANYSNSPQNLITAIVESNLTRKKHIANTILNKNVKVIGIYRLTMKYNSDNFRQSAILDIINFIKNIDKEKDIIIYEPLLNKNEFMGCKIENNINTFKKNADIIVANRIDDELKSDINKVYSRDIFKNN